MNTRISQHDLSYLTSAILLVVATVTAITGLVSDLWDLNDFVYHKYGGYTLALLAIAHVYLHWNRLVSYTRWRLKGYPRRRRVIKLQHKARIAMEDSQDKTTTDSREGNRMRLARRAFIPLALGSVCGFALRRFLQSEPELNYGSDIGAIYHEWSKPKLLSLLGTITNWGRQPPLYKEYSGVSRIMLPPPNHFRGLYTEETIQQRRSRRNFTSENVTLSELSRLLHYTGGITEQRWGRELRSAPSAGALYPIEVYLVIHRVENLEAGLYHYAVQDHALELLQAEDLRDKIVRHGLMQEFLGQANLVFVFTAIFQRLRWKYQERSYRYALIEAGHLGQNVYLTGTSMGMGVCAVGAFIDDDLNAMLGVDGQDEAAIYMLAAGQI